VTGPVLSLPTIEVYSRPGCHLCEQLIEELMPRIRGCLQLQVHNIDTRADWSEAYGLLIPMVRFDNRQICHFSLDHAAIDRIVRDNSSPIKAS